MEFINYLVDKANALISKSGINSDSLRKMLKRYGKALLILIIVLFILWVLFGDSITLMLGGIVLFLIWQYKKFKESKNSGNSAENNESNDSATSNS